MTHRRRGATILEMVQRNDDRQPSRQGPAAPFDALPPREMARKAEGVGEQKVAMPAGQLFVLSILAGAFIAMGAVFATTAMAGGAGMPYGVLRIVGGIAFSLGLVLVVVAGAELFTGNNLIVMAWASRRVTTAAFVRNLAIVYGGNLVGALGTALLMLLSKQYAFGGGAVGRKALEIAVAKTELGFVQAVVLGAFCNALVCLAVWLTYSARTTTDRILAIVPPIAAFVAIGFEHSVANMYFIPFGLLLKGEDQWLASTPGLPALDDLTWASFLLDNLLPVTLGNLIGGTLMVGALYWFVYLRRSAAAAPGPGGSVPTREQPAGYQSVGR